MSETIRRRRVLVVALLSATLLRLPALRWDVISDDEAIYDAMAHVVAEGGVMYHDTIDHKPPGLTYTYAACRLLAGRGDGAAVRAMFLVHLVGLLAVLGTCLALYGVGGRLLGGEGGAWAALLYAVASAAKQPVDGLAVNGELLMNLPVALAALCVVEAARRSGPSRGLLDLAAGMLCGVAALYKYQAAVVGLAFPLLLFEGPGVPERRRVRAFLASGLAWIVGLVLPIAAAVLYFRHRGVLDEAIFWGLRFNRHYLAQGPGLAWSLERLGLQLVGVVLPAIALYGGAALGILALVRPPGQTAPDIRAGRSFLTVWALVSVLAVGLGGRFFGHYFLQAEVPLALLAAGPVSRLFSRAPRRAALLALPALAFFALAAAPSVSRRLFSADDPDYAAAGAAAARLTRADDTVWVWGNVPQVYHAADRRHGVRFSFCNYLTGLSPATPSEYDRNVDPASQSVPQAIDMALADLASRRPALVIDTAEHDLKHYGRFPLSRFPALAAWLAAHYRRAETVTGFVFYRRVD